MNIDQGTDEKENLFKKWLFPTLLFLFVFTVRMIISIQHPNLTYDSYYDVRQVEHILETGVPDFNDELSYGGRTTYFSPVYHYIIASFSFLFNIENSIKILSNLRMAFLVVMVYLLSYKIVKNKLSAYSAALISFLIPILFFEGLFSSSVFSIVLPLIIFLLYVFIDIDVEPNVYWFVIFSIFVALIHPVSILFLFSLLIYFIILRMSGMKKKEKATESFLASIFIILWAQLIIYKKAFLIHGTSIIYQNIPAILLTNYYPQIFLIDLMAFLGVIPFVIGSYITYKYLFKAKNRSIFLIISLATISLLAVWLRLVEPREGLLFLGLSFSILCGVYFAEIIAYLKLTKFYYPKLAILAVLTITAVFSISFIISDFDKETSQIVPQNIIIDLKKLANDKEEIIGDKTTAAPIKYGHAINYFAKKPNMIDYNYLLRNDIDTRVKDLDKIYTSNNQIEILELFDFYKIGYVIVDDTAREKYNIKEHPAFYTPACFEIFQGDITIYKRKCELLKS